MRRKLSSIFLVVAAAISACSGEDDLAETARIHNPVVEACTDRNAPLLLGLSDAGRNCQYDIDCPKGAFCNSATALCDWHCLPDAGFGCDGGDLCDCFGRCSHEIGATDNKLMLPVLSAQPAFLHFGQVSGAWLPQALEVVVAFPQSASVPSWVEESGVTVRLRAGPSLLVSCDAGASPSFVSECSVTLESENFRMDGEDFVAQVEDVQLLPTGLPPDGIWTAEISSDDTSPPRLLLTGEPVDGPGGPRREWWGHVELSTGGDQTGQSTRFRVRAWSDQDTLLIYDESRILSPSGKVLLESNPTDRAYVAAFLPGATGGLSVLIDADDLPPLSGPNNVTGRFNIGMPAPVSGRPGQYHNVRVDYSLTRIKDADLSGCGSCSLGTVCEPAVDACVPGPAWNKLAAAEEAENNVTSELRQAWVDPDSAEHLETGLTVYGSAAPYQLAEAVMCSQGDEHASGHFKSRRFVSSREPGSILGHSGDLMCDDGTVPYTADYFTQWDRYPEGGPGISRNRLRTADMLDECLSDLARTPPVWTGQGTGDWFKNRFGAVYTTSRLIDPATNDPDPSTPGRCVSLSRLFAALELARQGGSSREQRLSARLLQQWIGVNGFVAHQTVQAREAAEFLGEDLSTRPEIERLDEALLRMERGWDVILDLHYRKLMPGSDESRTCVHLAPDYRRGHTPVATWRVTADGSIKTRGDGVAWRDGPKTFFYRGKGLNALCNSPDTIPLFQIGFGSSDRVDAPSALAGQCDVPAGTSNQMLRVTRFDHDPQLNGGSVYHWWTRSAGSSDLTIAYRTDPDNSRFYPVKPIDLSDPTPQPSGSAALPILAFPLRPGPGFLSGAEGSELAVWDYDLEENDFSQAFTDLGGFVPASDFVRHGDEMVYHDQAIGLPAFFMEGLAAYLRLLSAELERAEGEVLAACGPAHPGSARDKLGALFGRSMRYALTIEALAAAGRARDLAACNRPELELPWDRRWEEARHEVASLKQQAMDRFTQISQCAPFGLSLNQAPIFPVEHDFSTAVAKYFSNSTRLYEIASKQVERAIDDAEAARQAWVAARENEVRRRESAQARKLRLRELNKQYGAQVLQLCGLGGEFSAETVLSEFDLDGALSLATCHLKPGCVPTEPSLANLAEDHHIRFTFCTWQKMLEADPSLELADNIDPNAVSAYNDPALSIQHPQPNDVSPYRSFDLSFNGTLSTVRLRQLYGIPFNLKVEVPAEVERKCYLSGIFNQFDCWGGFLLRPPEEVSPALTGRVSPGAASAAHEACVVELGISAPMPMVEAQDTCYRGTIGEAVLALAASEKASEVARAQWAASQESFDLAVQTCHTAANIDEEVQKLADQHRERMKLLLAKKAKADKTANSLQGWGQLINLSPNPFGFASHFSGGKSIDLAAEIQQAELEFQAAVEKIKNQASLRVCLLQARHHLTAVKAQALNIETAMLEAQRALTSLEGTQTRLAQLVTEGRAVVSREEDDEIPGFAHHFWLSERITAARQSFGTAKQFAYLFGRALEYEKQQSNVALGSILSARGPHALRSAFARYAYSQVNKTVSGNAPEGAPFALRVRDDVLRLAPGSSDPGEWGFSPSQRFTAHLLSSAGAIYDAHGRYLGQGFAFAIPEVPNTNQCAERLWDLHVQLSGGSQLKAWVEKHGRPALRLRQRNTFASRMCADASTWQTTFVRPSWSAEDWPVPGEEMAFTETIVKASAGTSFYDFETTGDGPFGSTKLRGRGLYSEYEIVFPWEGLLAQNNRPTDFPLHDIIDIWLRIEPLYVIPAR